MITFSERADHSVDHMFVFWLFVILFISLFGFEGGIWVLISIVSGHCILINFITDGSQAGILKSFLLCVVWSTCF